MLVVIMRLLSGFRAGRKSSALVAWCVGSMCLAHALATATSVHNWHNVLRHPHYADDGHHHARHVGTSRSRNARVQDQEELFTDISRTTSTKFPSTTTRMPGVTSTTVIQRSPTVSSRTYHSSVRPSVPQYVNRQETAYARSNSSHSRESAPTHGYGGSTSPSVPSSNDETTVASSRAVSTASVPSASARILPQQDYYNINNNPPEGNNGLHKYRKNSGSRGPHGSQDFLSKVSEEMENVKLANEHFLMMRGVGRCKVPRAQVIRVKDVYPDPGKEYLPRCTVLHRCNDQSGCCDADTFQCMPKVMQEVALNFYIINVGKEIHSADLGNSVTKLLFVNHTECECLPIDNLPRVADPAARTQQDAQHSHLNDNGIQNHPSRCQECPHPFCKREYPDGRCSCDCFDRQRPCLRIKRGREAMHESERRCVETGKCHAPECEYGIFDATLGRCPRRPEDQRRNHNNQRNQQNNNHRWTYFERD